MRGKQLRGLIIIAASIIGISVGAYYYKQPKEADLDLQTLILHLDAERKEAIDKPISYDIETLKKNLKPNDFTQEEVDALLIKGEPRTVTKQEAIEDIETLFRMLSESYGGYIYFGEKERFSQAKKEIITAVDSSNEEKVSPEVLAQILCEKLDFIVDNHFWINGKQTAFKEKYCYYANGINEIKKDSKAYYILKDKKKYYIDEQVENYIKPTIGKTGQLVYGLFAIVNEQEKEILPTSIHLKSGNQQITQMIEWKLCNVGTSKMEEGRNNYTYKEVENIPVIAYKEMMYTQESNEFIEDGEKFRDVPVAVLDLRGNTGGSPFINLMWLYQITGEKVYPKQIEIDYFSPLLSYITTSPNRKIQRTGAISYTYDDSKVDFFKDIKQYTEMNEKGNIIHWDEGRQWIENDTLWFILVNKQVYSAGEVFLRQLESMSHVVLVGSNSNGCLTVTNPIVANPLYLPHSKLSIVFGNGLTVADDMEGYDELGTLPDLYIADEDALEAVIRCYQYYKK